MSEISPKRVKIVILGMSGVGKSSLMLQFIEGDFISHSYSTIGVDIKRRPLTLETSGKAENLLLELWDTAGQEKFRTFVSAHFRSTDRALLVYDISSQESFRELDFWRKELNRFTDLAPEQIYLVGNKADLGSLREVSSDMLLEYAERYGFGYQEVSATNKEQIDQLFTNVVTRAPIKERVVTNSIPLEQGTASKSKKLFRCC